jgi:hypothetical protein
MAGYPHVGQDADSGVQEQWCFEYVTRRLPPSGNCGPISIISSAFEAPPAK